MCLSVSLSPLILHEVPPPFFLSFPSLLPPVYFHPSPLSFPLLLNKFLFSSFLPLSFHTQVPLFCSIRLLFSTGVKVALSPAVALVTLDKQSRRPHTPLLRVEVPLRLAAREGGMLGFVVFFICFLAYFLGSCFFCIVVGFIIFFFLFFSFCHVDDFFLWIYPHFYIFLLTLILSLVFFFFLVLFSLLFFCAISSWCICIFIVLDSCDCAYVPLFAFCLFKFDFLILSQSPFLSSSNPLGSLCPFLPKILSPSVTPFPQTPVIISSFLPPSLSLPFFLSPSLLFSLFLFP